MSFAPFIETLDRSGLPGELRNSIRKTLGAIFSDRKVLEATYDDIMPPNRVSFDEMLAFVKTHPTLPAPSINLNPEGIFSLYYYQRPQRDFHLTFRGDAAVDEFNVNNDRGKIDVEMREGIRPQQIQVPRWAAKAAP